MSSTKPAEPLITDIYNNDRNLERRRHSPLPPQRGQDRFLTQTNKIHMKHGDAGVTNKRSKETSMKFSRETA